MLLWITAAGGGASAQEARGTTGADIMSEARDEHLHVQVSAVEASDAALVVRYEVRNVGQQPVWLFNQLFKVDAGGYYTLDPAKAYARAEGGGKLVLSKALQPVPPGEGVEFPEVPCVSRLEPGAMVAELVRLAFPVRETQPYLDTRRSLARSEIALVRLRVGYFLDAPEIHFHKSKDTTGKPFQYPTYSYGSKNQVMLEVGPLPVAPARPVRP